MSLLFIFWLKFILLCGQETTSRSIAVYPTWFWEMPVDSSATFAVGYARHYTRIDTSYAYARRNCIWQLLRSMQVTIDASQELFNQVGQNKLIGFQEVESIDSSLASAINENFTIIDSAVVGDMVISLAQFSGNTNFQIVKDRIAPSQRPPWIDTLPQEDSVIYAVGTAPLYYYEHHSWDRAEANARFQLAYTLGTKIQSMNWMEQASMKTWSEAKASIQLRQTTVVKRWLDWSNRQCYVLCRMPL